MRRLRAFLRLRRMRQAHAQRVIRIAGRTLIERRRRRNYGYGDFSDVWLSQRRAANADQ